MFSSVCQHAPLVVPAKAAISKKSKDWGPVCAVIEVEVSGDFRPKSTDSIPCEGYGVCPAGLHAMFARMYNADRSAEKQRRWACVGINGSIIFLAGISFEIRPSDPAAYPPGAVTGLTYDQALAAMESANEERLRIARVPRRWTIALRPLVLVEGGVA